MRAFLMEPEDEINFKVPVEKKCMHTYIIQNQAQIILGNESFQNDYQSCD